MNIRDQRAPRDGQHHVLTDKLHRQLAATEQLHPQAEFGGFSAPQRLSSTAGMPLPGHPRLRLFAHRPVILMLPRPARYPSQPRLELQPDETPARQHALAVDAAGEHGVVGR